jgi:hypothetical protein
VLLAYESGNGPRHERVARVWVTNPPVGDLFEALVLLPEGTASSSSSRDVVREWKLVSVGGAGVAACRCCCAVYGLHALVLLDTKAWQQQQFASSWAAGYICSHGRQRD